jgi:hypothetical protein
MNIPSLSEITGKAQNAFKRFPLTLIWAIFGTFFCIYLIEYSSRDFFDDHFNAILTLIVGISWLIGTQFFIEQLENPKKWQWLKLVVLALLGLLYWYLPTIQHYDDTPVLIFRFFLYFIAGHLFVLFAPFLLKWDKNAYWNYLKNIGTAILRSLFYSGILYLGLVLALAAIDALFDVTIKGKRYGQLFIFCLGTVNTFVYLSDFPKNIFQNKTIYFQKALEVLVKYILIPLVLLYLVILYAYSAKIVIQWELPKGWVSYLVIALSFLGYTIQVIINPIQKDLKSWTITKFHPWFYYLLIPLNVLLFVAIIRRITDYGITENRYFVFLIAVWNVGIILYLLLSRKKALKVLPISLFIIAILSSIGFWSAFNVSKNSQINQFSKLFATVKNNDITATQDELDRLKSILDYLEERKKVSSLDKITKLNLEGFRDSIVDDYRSYGYLDQNKIWDSLAIKLDSTSLAKNLNDYQYYNLYSSWENAHFTSVSGFDNFAYLDFYSYSQNKISLDSLVARFESKSQKILISSKKDGEIKLEFSLIPRFNDLKKYGNNLSKASENDITIEANSESLSGKLVFIELGFQEENDSIFLNNTKAVLFLKKN